MKNKMTHLTWQPKPTAESRARNKAIRAASKLVIQTYQTWVEAKTAYNELVNFQEGSNYSINIDYRGSRRAAKRSWKR